MKKKKKTSFKDISFDCDSCRMGNSKTLPFLMHVSLASKCFYVVHSDVWGIAPVVSHSHFKYFVTFIDDYSCFTWICFLRSKSKVFSIFQVFLAYVENQFSTSIKTLRFDSDRECLQGISAIFAIAGDHIPKNMLLRSTTKCSVRKKK